MKKRWLQSRFVRESLEQILWAVLLAIFIRNFIIAGYRVPAESMSPTLKPGDFIFSNNLAYGIKVPFTQIGLFKRMPERGDIVVFTRTHQPHLSFVKRVIGLPGDRIEIIEGRLLLNGNELQYSDIDSKVQDSEIMESPKKITDSMSNVHFENFKQDLQNQENLKFYWEHLPGQKFKHIIMRDKRKLLEHFGPLVVPPNEVFLLNDFRDLVDDSRSWGTLPWMRIDSKVLMIWFSLRYNSEPHVQGPSDPKKMGEKSSIRSPSFIRWNRMFHL